MLRQAPWKRLGLATRLTLTHAIVATSIIVLTVLLVRALGLRVVTETQTTTHVLVDGEALAASVGRAAEESFSYMLAGAPHERDAALEQFSIAVVRIDALGRDPLTTDEKNRLAAVSASLATMRTDANAMFASYRDSRGIDPVLQAAFERSLDETTDRIESFNTLLQAQRVTHAEDARADADDMLLIVSLVAAALSLVIGRIVGQRLATPILAVRDAAHAFGAGAPDAIEKLPTRTDEIGDVARALRTLASDQLRHLAAINRARQDLADVFASIRDTLVVTDDAGIIVEANARKSLVGEPIAALFALATAPSEAVRDEETTMRARDGTLVPVHLTASRLRAGCGYVFLARDLSEKRRLEVELRQAQKLETIGRLTAGVAHEMNTPLQYIGDSVAFLRDACAELIGALQRGRRDDDDVDFAMTEIPGAIERASDGVARVAEIVHSLKGFSHPNRNRAAVDVNKLIGDTLVMAHHEYKYVADVEQQPCDMPLVECYASELSQALLNLVVNAAHAIAGKEGVRGKIIVATRIDGDDLLLSVADNGPGIPLELQQKIFEPFFTTKPVGLGTGQGLPIVSEAVKRHGGTLTFTTGSSGTTFRIRIPRTHRVASKAA